MKITLVELLNIIKTLEGRFRNVSPLEKKEYEAITTLLGIYYNKIKGFSANEFIIMKVKSYLK